MICYELRRACDGELVAEGSFSAALLRDERASTGGCSVAASHSVQLAPLVHANARALLSDGTRRSLTFPLTFPASSRAFALAHPTAAAGDDRSKDATSANKQQQQQLQCTLKLVGATPMPSALEDSATTWFDAKLRRAGEWRARGNDAFKSNKLLRAVRAYRKALRWLACPSGCTYDPDEAAAVAPIALACHSNLATSLWKLGKLDECIAQATLALQHEPANVKALFRRGQALAETKAFEDAVHDLERAHQLEPDNKLIRSGLERARVALSRHNAKQRQAFAKLF